ncbi:MAG: glycosyltransferase family 39 protein [Proteobacteria bacterium]|nr:glycosyltransferase family 39 protein [Pseudomonadota bacterium]
MRPVFVAAVLVWLPSLMLLWFYRTGSSDEGAYHYQALHLAAGNVPVIDYFTSHAIWAYLPFAAVAGLLGPSLEAGRLFAALSVAATVAMVTSLASRHYGKEIGLYAFVLMAFCWTWIENNLEVRHSAVANLALISAVFVLARFDRHPLLRIAVAGFCVGVMVNSRAVLLPLGIVVLASAWMMRRRWNLDMPAARFLVTFAAAGLVPSIPSILILAADPESFMFNYLLHRVAWTAEQATERTWVEATLWFVSSRAAALRAFFSPNEHANLLTLLPLAGSVAVFLPPLVRRRRAAALFAGTVPVISAIVLVGIFASYSLADRFASPYLHHWIPFLVLLGLGAYANGAAAIPRLRWIVRGGVMVAALLNAAEFTAQSAVSVVLRGDPFQKRPLEIARVACWIDRNLPEDAVAMDYLGAAVAASGRRLPAGFEQGVGAMAYFWEQPYPEELATRFKILTLPQYVAMLESGAITAVITSGLAERRLNPADFALIAERIANRYAQVPSAPGASAYQIFLRNDLVGPGVLPYRPALWFREGKDGLVRGYWSQGEYAAMAADVFGDIGISLRTLPADLVGSVARLVWLDYEARCGRLLPASAG